MFWDNNNDQNNNQNNEQNNSMMPLPGQTIHVNNPNFLEKGQPIKFEITNHGNSISIIPRW